MYTKAYRICDVIDADFDTIFGDPSIDARQHPGRYVSIDGVMIGKEH
jgi:hypothetical protein